VRTIEKIEADIEAAIDARDAATLRRLANEARTLSTARTDATAERAMGFADFFTDDHPSALEHYRRALMVLEELNDRNGVAMLTGNMGSVYYSTGEYTLALEHYRRAIAVHAELGDRSSVARFTGNIGTVYAAIGDYESSLDHFRRALAMHEALGEHRGVANVTSNMGNVFVDTGDYPSALEHYRRALSIYEEHANRSGIASTTGNIGNVYQLTCDYPSALEQYRRALSMHEELASRSGIARIASNMGLVYHQTDDNPLAMECFRRALAIYEDVNDRSGVARVVGNIGVVHHATGDYSSALECYRRALDLHEALGERSGVAAVTGNMIATLLGLHRYDDAKDMMQRHSLMAMDKPGTRAMHHANHAMLSTYLGDLETAREQWITALEIANEAGLRSAAADYHMQLRDLAQQRNDLAAYVEHNIEHARLAEEIRGKEATQKIAMMEAERKIEQVERERAKERALLYGALPKSVADRMIRGEKVSGDHFEAAAVLFADVADFTRNTSALHPSDVVTLLDELFAVVDAICEGHAVVKVKTIGDTYMCFKGDASPAENAQAIDAVALEIHAHVSIRTYPNTANHIPLRMRIGLHIGPATAGVLGTQRLQYDVWGDTVNVASRMESTGEPGRIHISASFAQALINAPYSIVPRGEVEIKGKGAMTTYWLEAS